MSRQANVEVGFWNIHLLFKLFELGVIGNIYSLQTGVLL